MGLDMYLRAKKYLWNDTPIKTEVNELVKRITNGLEVKEVIAEAAYWRKANAIHSWFVENVQDGEDNCAEYYVSSDKLSELRDVVNAVLKDTREAGNLLPPQEGFFFGSNKIDEWYFQDLEYTKEVLDKILADEFKDWDFYYRSSW
jgi:hypothetical protein